MAARGMKRKREKKRNRLNRRERKSERKSWEGRDMINGGRIERRREEGEGRITRGERE